MPQAESAVLHGLREAVKGISRLVAKIAELAGHILTIHNITAAGVVSRNPGFSLSVYSYGLYGYMAV